MNIFLREARSHLKGFLIWSLSIALLIALASVELDTFRASTEGGGINEMMEAFPVELRAAFSLDVIRLDTAEGYYSYIAQFLMTAAAIYAALAGGRVLSKEIYKKTVETTFVLPVTRRKIIACKAGVSLMYCALLSLLIFILAVSFFGTQGGGTQFAADAIIVSVFIFLIQLLFVLAGMFTSVITKRHKRTGAVMASVTVGMYMLSFAANLGEKTEYLRYFTPFEYFSPVAIMNNGTLEVFGFVVVPVLLVSLFLATFYLLDRKDIY